MFIIISYIWPISSQNIEAIHMGKNLYDSDLSCPGDKHPPTRAVAQSKKSAVVLSVLEGSTGKCGGLEAISRGSAFTMLS